MYMQHHTVSTQRLVILLFLFCLAVVGELLKFPTTTEEVQALLKRIGVDGVRYQEIFIVSFDGDVLGYLHKLNTANERMAD